MVVVADLMSEIVVVNDFAWLGNPRFGVFTVAIDGRRLGRAPLDEELRCSVAPGSHTVRVRQWHYKSPRLTVEVLPGAPTVLRANKPAGPVWKAMLRLAFRPFHALSVEPDTADVGSAARAHRARRRGQKSSTACVADLRGGHGAFLRRRSRDVEIDRLT